MCQHSSSRTKIAAFKIISLVLAFLMPAFLLANYVYYLQLGYSQQRQLQTADDGGTNAFRTKQFMVKFNVCTNRKS